ncbi:MAG TPA: aminotransferase class IV [Gammaproteobacteria bacterium]|nr:aminotransferase class IV [Gammaproteobacteria bacterium]
MLSLSVLEEKEILENLQANDNPHFDTYYAFYSSWFGGIIKNPRFMLLPLDDHMVHRGDGVFEAMKSVNRSIYLLDAHLHRLFQSAEKIGIQSPYNFAEIKEIILQTLKAANQSDTAIRIFLSRGPGSFSMNPYDSVKPQLYVVVTKLSHPPREKYEKGVKIGKSVIPMKTSWMAQVKSCNYLPNVLMKKEAVDRKLDFVVGIDEKNYISEGCGENIIIVDADGTIVHPPLNSILKGTTMIRTCELADKNGIPTKERLISCDELQSAREVMMTGTTIDILPVIQFEDQIIGDGTPGKIFQKLNQIIKNDIEKGANNTVF